jgi:hypothetical protein
LDQHFLAPLPDHCCCGREHCSDPVTRISSFAVADCASAYGVTTALYVTLPLSVIWFTFSENDVNELFARKPILAPATPSQDFAPWDSQNSAPIESVKELQVEHRLVEEQFGHQPLEAIAINLARVVSLSPMIVGRLGDAVFPTEVRARQSFCQIAVGFA